MAELILITGEHPRYSDGDVLDAFNDDRIRSVHAQHLCHVREAGMTREGLRPLNGLAKRFRDLTWQFRFERVSQHEARRVTLATGAEESIQFSALDEFIRNLKKSPDHGVFGAAGREVWYGGLESFAPAAINAAWEIIASITDRTKDESEFTLWPFGRLDIRKRLAVRVADFSQAESDALVSPRFELDRNGAATEKILSKRNIKVDWRGDLLDDLKVTEREVLDQEIPVGREIVISKDKIRYESKDQPVQNDRTKLQSKELGGRLSKGGE